PGVAQPGRAARPVSRFARRSAGVIRTLSGTDGRRTPGQFLDRRTAQACRRPRSGRSGGCARGSSCARGGTARGAKMKRTLSLIGTVLLSAALGAAQPDPASLEPAVDTSKAAAPVATPAPATTVTPAAPAKGQAGPAAASASARREAKPAAGRTAQDRVDLEATQITGNRELPRVMYVVPWKKGELGDLGGKPANSLLDEVLTPVDRDVFRRQN